MKIDTSESTDHQDTVSPTSRLRQRVGAPHGRDTEFWLEAEREHAHGTEALLSAGVNPLVPRTRSINVKVHSARPRARTPVGAAWLL